MSREALNQSDGGDVNHLFASRRHVYTSFDPWIKKEKLHLGSKLRAGRGLSQPFKQEKVRRCQGGVVCHSGASVGVLGFWGGRVQERRGASCRVLVALDMPGG